MDEESEYIPTVEQLKKDFAHTSHPKLYAYAAKFVGLFRKHIERETVRWDPDWT